MSLNAQRFIQNRGKDIVSITYNRIRNIISYTLECYQLLLTDKPTYSRAHVSTVTAYHFEDYLKMRLVDDYLVKNKHLLAAKISELEEVTFNYETVKPFIDINDGIERSDKIDVYVNRLGLKDQWTVEEEHLYLAIECKRITALSDCQAYAEDIQKFCNREYTSFRLPFESQIAFIENPKLTHVSIKDEINKRLKRNSTITTRQYLTPVTIHKSFKCSYSSIHKKNFKKKDPFTIFHLLLNYSQLVTG